MDVFSGVMKSSGFEDHMSDANGHVCFRASQRVVDGTSCNDPRDIAGELVLHILDMLKQFTISQS